MNIANNFRISIRKIVSVAFLGLCILGLYPQDMQDNRQEQLQSLLLESPISTELLMAAALENDSSLADARTKLAIAKSNLFKSNPLYATALVFNGSAKGGGTATEKNTANDVQKTLSANLTIPFTRWLSLSAQGSTDLIQTTTLSLSTTLSLFAKPDTSTQVAWNKAMIEAQQAVRNTLLSVRKEYRALITSRAEYAFREASVRSAENELARVKYLVELGQARPSEQISVHSDLLDAQGYLDTATNAMAHALQSLSARTLLDLNANSVFEEPVLDDKRTLVDEEQWLLSSSDFALSRINYETSKTTSDVSPSLPDISFGAGITDTHIWTLSAKVSLSPDLLFQQTKAIANASLSIQERSLTASERAVRLAWKNQYNAYLMANRNYTTASSFYSAAVLSYEETQLLFDRGDVSLSGVDTVNEKLLSAIFQKMKALEALENARDVLDTAWQLSL